MTPSRGALPTYLPRYVPPSLFQNSSPCPLQALQARYRYFGTGTCSTRPQQGQPGVSSFLLPAVAPTAAPFCYHDPSRSSHSSISSPFRSCLHASCALVLSDSLCAPALFPARRRVYIQPDRPAAKAKDGHRVNSRLAPRPRDFCRLTDGSPSPNARHCLGCLDESDSVVDNIRLESSAGVSASPRWVCLVCMLKQAVHGFHAFLTSFQGLLPLLKSIQRPIELKSLHGETLGVDAYGWLHRAAFSCAGELGQGKPTNK